MPTEWPLSAGDDDAAYLPNGTPVSTPGNAAWTPRTFVTECRLLDRLGTERTYGFTVTAGSWEQAERVCKVRGLGEKVIGEVMSPNDIIPA